jgi:hypothetical protein
LKGLKRNFVSDEVSLQALQTMQAAWWRACIVRRA